LDGEKQQLDHQIRNIEGSNQSKQNEMLSMTKNIELKKLVIDDLQKQLKKLKEETEQERTMNEQTMNIKFTEQEKKEILLSTKLIQT